MQAWAKHVFHDEDLLGVILRAHLLLERAVDLRLNHLVKRPEALQGGRFIRLAYAEKAAFFLSLCSASDGLEQTLLGFNRLRNAVAHAIDPELDELIPRILPQFVIRVEGASARPTSAAIVDLDATVKAAFVFALLELGVFESITSKDTV